MSTPMAANEVLDREFFPIRAKILEIGAMLDRLQRATGSVDEDQRLERVAQAIAVLQREGADRAEEIQMIFSLPYDESWRKKFSL